MYYPPVKTKARQEEVKEAKPCPQKTVIDYPEMPRKSKYKYNAIDFVPRRKPGELIQAETNVEKARIQGLPPGKAGVNRAAMIENLQERNLFENKQAYEKYQVDKRRKAELMSQAPTEISD